MVWFLVWGFLSGGYILVCGWQIEGILDGTSVGWSHWAGLTGRSGSRYWSDLIKGVCETEPTRHGVALRAEAAVPFLPLAKLLLYSSNLCRGCRYVPLALISLPKSGFPSYKWQQSILWFTYLIYLQLSIYKWEYPEIDEMVFKANLMQIGWDVTR